ncbi:hypothetical protein EVJ58_g11177, partial [Rhodofomes roseus]
LAEAHGVIEGFNELVSQYKGELTVAITSVAPLPSDIRRKLESSLKQSRVAQKAKSVKVAENLRIGLRRYDPPPGQEIARFPDEGSIRLRLTSSVKAAVKNKTTSKALWDELKALYDKQTPAGVYKEFRTAINARIPPNEHPNPTFANIAAAFDKLAGEGIDIPAPLRAMIALNALPSRYNTVVTTILQAKELTEMKIDYVRESVVIAYEQGG